jgi:hypothetical protein
LAGIAHVAQDAHKRDGVFRGIDVRHQFARGHRASGGFERFDHLALDFDADE